MRLSILSYDVIKSLHLIAVISWMVGLLYLPRLFVYHNESMQKSDLDKTFLIMEYRLYHYIMNPALILTCLCGSYLLYQSHYLLSENYFLLKSIFVFLLIVFHVYLYFLYKDFKKGYRFKITKFYRIINEIPTVLMIIVIILIFVKPDLQI